MSTITRQIILTKDAAQAIGPYSQAVRVDNTLYLSGSLGIVPETGELVNDCVEEQCKQTLKNMGEVLAASGANFNNVIKTTVLLTDMKDFAAVNKVYKEFFTDNYPARAAYQVSALPKYGAKVEIEAIAVLGKIVELPEKSNI